MKKDVIISIHGRQQLNDPDTDMITLVTQGKFYHKDGKFYVTYDESELTGLMGTKTTLKVGEGSVSVLRTGRYPSQLLFEKGKRHMTLYHTDYGELTVSVSTEEIDCNLTEDGGSLSVRYAVEIDHAHAGMNHLHLTIRPVDGQEPAQG